MKADAEVFPYTKLKISRGTQYTTTNPRKPGIQTAQRTYCTIAGIGSTKYTDQVKWAGSGGYYCIALKKDVDIVD